MVAANAVKLGLCQPFQHGRGFRAAIDEVDGIVQPVPMHYTRMHPRNEEE